MLTTLILIIIATCSLVLFLLKSKTLLQKVRLARKMPGPSLWELAIVHARHLLSADSVWYFCELTAQYDYKPWNFWKGTDLLVVISDPDTIGAAFRSKDVVNKEAKFYDGVKDLCGECSILLNGPEWKVRRALINPAFKKGILESNLDVMYEESLKTMQKIKESAGETDICFENLIERTLATATVRSLASPDFFLDEKLLDDAVWGLSFGCELIHLKYVNPLWFKFLQFSDKSYRESVERAMRVAKDLKDVIREELARITYRMKSEFSPGNQALVFLHQAMLKKNCLSERDILSEMIFIIAASLETTTTALCAAVYMLALHPEAQSRAAEEVDGIFSQSERSFIVPDDLNQMEYLERVIKESMRLFSPAGLIVRHANEETNLNGTVIPKGSAVIFNFQALHRCPKVFEDPLKFQPDRFLPGVNGQRHPYAFMPFSAGARNCVGRHHAMLMMKIILSTLLRNFKILPGQGMKSVNDIKTKFGFTLHMRDNYTRLVPRDGVPL